jgi:hypothetical protein
MKQSARLGTAVLCASLSLGLVFVFAQAADQPKGPGAQPGAAAGTEVPAGATLPPDRVKPVHHERRLDEDAKDSENRTLYCRCRLCPR